MKRKAAVSPIQKLKTRALSSAQKLGAARRVIEHEREQHEQQVRSMNDKNDTQSKIIADKVAAIAARDEKLRDQATLTAIATAERDRLVRIIDQFTSVTITPHMVPMGVLRDSVNLPQQLRRT